MTNEQKELLDKMLKEIDNGISKVLAEKTMVIAMAALADETFGEECSNYYFNGIISILNEHIEMAEKEV
jgi:hypothetical protein